MSKKSKKKLIIKFDDDFNQNDIKDKFEKEVKTESMENANYKKFLLRKEKLQRENFDKNDNYNFLYPHLDDKEFNKKIYLKKEFNDTKYDGTIYDVKKQSDILCNMEIELSSHQLFVKNFLSFQTPYNGLLLYHGLGTGKTCSAISVCEETRDYLKQVGITKRIIIVASPNVQDNFKLQMFNPSKLKLIDGLWNIKGCTSNKYLKEINPMNMRGFPKDKVIRQIKKIINQSYLFLGYIEFSNYIERTIKKAKSMDDDNEKQIIKMLNKEFSSRLIVIDEIHNIRMTDDNTNKKIGQNLLKLIVNTEGIKLLLLSATPMFNSHSEIIWLLNLLNLNDKRAPISYSDIFTKDGLFKKSTSGSDKGIELLKRKATGYISFIKGDNPYLFPYRIFPTYFESDKVLSNFIYPKKQVNGKQIEDSIKHVDVYVNGIGDYQLEGYNFIIDSIKQDIPEREDDNEYGLGYQLLDAPIQSLNFLYPSEDLDDVLSSESREDVKDVNIRSLIGKNGLERCMKYDQRTKKSFEYNEDTEERYGKIFSSSNIEKYSKKIKTICDKVIISNGITLIYSQYIDGGCVPVALALESLGFKRFGEKKNSLFKEQQTTPLNVLTMKPKISGEDFKQASYAMITGDNLLSPNNKTEFIALSDDDNKYGNKIKVVIISKAGSEGLDFKFIRNVHILDPWYNMNRIEQIIGRGVRTCSHINLPFEERNVCIYLHSTYIDEEEETVDMYIYRLAEIKSIKIGNVSRVLKQSSVDCLLNVGQLNFTSENMKQSVTQKLSNMKEIKFDVGDKPFTSSCDYMETCNYTCDPNMSDSDNEEELINEDTYNERYITSNIDKIIKRIKTIFKENYVLKKDRLITEINVVKEYPLIQIDMALTELINDNNNYIYDYFGRSGTLVNVGNYYMFQPTELKKQNNISRFERTKPIDYKKGNIVIDVSQMKKYDDMVTKQLKPKTTKLVVLDKTKEKELEKKITKEKKIGKLLILKDDKKYATSATDTIQQIKTSIALSNINNEYGSLRSDKDWYKNSSKSIRRIVESEKVKPEVIYDLVADHFIEMLQYDKILDVIKYLFEKESESLSDFEKYIKSKIEKNIVEKDDIKILLLQENGEIRTFTINGNNINPSKASELEKVSELILAKSIDIENINDIVGFIHTFKGDYMIFKTKILLTKRSKGTRCDQSSKAVSVERLHSVLSYKKYDSTEVKTLSSLEICSEMELYLRLFDKNKKDGKRWFLTPVETIITDIEKLTK